MNLMERLESDLRFRERRLADHEQDIEKEQRRHDERMALLEGYLAAEQRGVVELRDAIRVLTEEGR